MEFGFWGSGFVVPDGLTVTFYNGSVVLDGLTLVFGGVDFLFLMV